MCINKKVVGWLVVAALGVLIFAPRLAGAALPLLIVAACPLSMVLMMRAMNRGSATPDSAARVHDLEAEVARLRAEVQSRTTDRSA